jgi:DNA-binding transcriptional ArsR family regulator
VEFRPTLPIALNAFRRLTSPPSRKMEDAPMKPRSIETVALRGVESVAPSDVEGVENRPPLQRALPAPRESVTEPACGEPAGPEPVEAGESACTEPVEEVEGPPSPVDPLDLFTEALQHDVATLIATAFSPARLRTTVALAQQAEPEPVTALAARLGATPDNVSTHLRPLRLVDLVREQHHGKEHHYSVNPDHIRLTLEENGGFTLDVLARKGGRVMLTLRVLGEGQEPFAADGHGSRRGAAKYE